jgi:inosose dehydratase
LTTQEKYLSILLKDYPSNMLGINFDTGNAFLSGNDPYRMLENLIKRVVHIHAKDIPESLSQKRGTVTGTRVGTAIGEGVIDFRKIITLLKYHAYSEVISVECDTLEQARASLAYLRPLLESDERPIGGGETLV